ncbi:BON domain-containing protein [Edaphobacter modestus]|uniref:BON domain-containing protein n=1 Tax=Edaphobacter modestus TaxID=388466 RepID=A0A4Q7YDQ6_9BACT|nr:BON domain-containing protein [Edaphobacter modestus]RZU35437.1 BON domain-containing protein [Edaphobacter modestus]
MTHLPHLRTIALLTLITGTIGAQTQKAPPPTDWQIEAQVQQALAKDTAFKGSSIISGVNKGVVTLTGNVRSESEKALASQDLANIEGVKTVLNNLTIVDNRFHAPAPSTPTGPTGPKVVTLAQGTAIPIRLTDEINTKTAKAGDSFHATTAASVTLAGFTVIPAGTPVTGRIMEAKPAGRLSGAAELAIELVSLRLPTPEGAQDISVVSQGLSSKAAGRGTNTAAKAGGGAALGAVVGALAGGGAGAGIGAASGGALGLGANLITHGKEIDLKPEQLLQFRTAAPLNVTIMLENGHQVLPTAAPGAQLQTRSATGSSPQ